MKKKQVTLGIALLLIIVFLGGCIETKKESKLLLNSLSFSVDDFEGDWELLYEDYVDIPYIEKDRGNSLTAKVKLKKEGSDTVKTLIRKQLFMN